MGRTSDTQERLIQAAAELMYARGYNAVGIKEVCEQAGVNKGSFYYFFPSKRDLILAILDVQWEEARQGLLETAFAEDIPVLDRFQRLFHLAAASQQGTCTPMQGCFFGNLALELSAQDEIIRQKLQSIFQTWGDYFECVLEKAVTAGELPQIDPKAAAQTILAYFEGVALLAKVNNDPGMVERLASGAVQLALASAPPADSNG